MNKPLREAITQLIGEATMCWEPIPPGVFDSQRAISISDQIMQLISATITDLQAKMPTKETIDTIHKYDVNTFNKGINQAVKQQQAVFKKVLEELK